MRGEPHDAATDFAAFNPDDTALVRIVARWLAAASVEFLQQASGIVNLALLWAMLHCYFSRGATAEWFCRREKREADRMGFFRSRSRLGSYLALFAIAFQLAVSFAHVHLEHVSPIAAAASALASAPTPSEEVTAPSAPADHETLADNCCQICALIHLAATIMPAETPPLPLPGIFFRLRHETAVAFDLTASHRVVFQARAPPIV
jgi:hypothetical protein